MIPFLLLFSLPLFLSVCLSFCLFSGLSSVLLFFKVIGGELQERLIPVPYSKNTTDQAVSAAPQQHFPFCVFLSLFYFIFYFYYYSYYSCSFFYFSSSSLPQIKHFVMEVTKEICERLVERHAESWFIFPLKNSKQQTKIATEKQESWLL